MVLETMIRKSYRKLKRKITCPETGVDHWVYNLIPFPSIPTAVDTRFKPPRLPSSAAKQLGEVPTATHEMIVEIGGPAWMKAVPGTGGQDLEQNRQCDLLTPLPFH